MVCWIWSDFTLVITFWNFRYDCCHIYYFVDENQVRRTLFDFLHHWRNWWNDFGSIFYVSLVLSTSFHLGLEVIDDLLDAHEKKLGFVCIWFSFAFALFLLNRLKNYWDFEWKIYLREHKRKTYDSIVNFGAWQALVLLAVGFLGGIFSAIAASGLDICSFSILSLVFRWAQDFYKRIILNC